MFHIGIDPGLGGGIAVLNNSGAVCGTYKMPATERDLLDLLEIKSDECRAVLEFVRSSPQMGVVSAFKFGMGYGGLRMALVASRIPFDEVTPQKWQRVMGCLTRGDKNVTKRRAQELFPSVKVTHANADALLLAAYSLRGYATGRGFTETKEF